ncbi:MAG TPA: hypothetical protein VFE59_41885 [Trebonia sp.]|jgi:hypothetical protein|nr:hypothetical protein [Trebonia sp.]
MKLGALTVANNMAALPSRAAGNRVGTTTLEAIRADLGRLRRLDDHLGGADTFSLYSREAANVASLIKTGNLTTAIRRELHSIYAEQTQQAGWAAFDAGWQDKATQMFERSYEAAKEAGANDLAGNALALRSYQLLAAGRGCLEPRGFSAAIHCGF